MSALTITDRSEQLGLELHIFLQDLAPGRWREDLEASLRQRAEALDVRLTGLLDEAATAHEERVAQLRVRLNELREVLRSSLPEPPEAAVNLQQRAFELRARWMAFRGRLEASYHELATSLKDADVRLPTIEQVSEETPERIALARKVGSVFKVVASLTYLCALSLIFAVALIVCFPFRMTRIHICNIFGSVAGKGIMWITGCPLKLIGVEEGREARPAIYISNHTSLLDIMLAMWLSPMGTVGVAKKEIMYYPFFGQLYLLSGHLRIDRSNRERAVASMNALSGYVKARGLSIFIWPEGTRSRTGRLKPFKKGVVHMALATGLPVIPMVVRGLNHAMEKGSLIITGEPVEVEFLPAIDVTGWRKETLETHVEQLQAAFVEALPPSQRPE